MSQLRELELRHLIAIEAVARTGTFGRAAIELGYTQSAVSQQIAALERLVDGKVFDRPGGPRPVTLTPLGERLLDGATDLLSRVDILGDELDRFRKGEVGRLTIGTFQSTSATILPQVLGQLRADHPDIDVSVVEADDDNELDEALARGELDLSFAAGDRGPAFERIHLLDDPFVLVARPGQFADGPVPIAELVDEPLIGQRAHSCQAMLETGLRLRTLDPDYVFRSDDNGTVTAMVRAGLGIAILPLLCVDPEDPRIALHHLDPQIPARQIGVNRPTGRTLSPVAERFIELAVEAGRAMEERQPDLGGRTPKRRSPGQAA